MIVEVCAAAAVGSWATVSTVAYGRRRRREEEQQRARAARELQLWREYVRTIPPEPEPEPEPGRPAPAAARRRRHVWIWEDAARGLVEVAADLGLVRRRRRRSHTQRVLDAHTAGITSMMRAFQGRD